MSPMMEFPEIKMPFICLLVSGGHSMIDVGREGRLFHTWPIAR